MDLKAKIDELSKEWEKKFVLKNTIHREMKELKKRISKYETVLKHAEEIESLPEEKEKV